uniref:Uncharacterized protein n=1 Tax=Anguilla anguilla TaxID=7936 RepID=A0A0E9WWH8_ANGAN
MLFSVHDWSLVYLSPRSGMVVNWCPSGRKSFSFNQYFNQYFINSQYYCIKQSRKSK